MHTPQKIDQLGLAIARHLGQQPEVSDGVAARLATARQVALSRAPARGTETVTSDVLALGRQDLRQRFLLLLLSALLFAAVGWHVFYDAHHDYGWQYQSEADNLPFEAQAD